MNYITIKEVMFRKKKQKKTDAYFIMEVHVVADDFPSDKGAFAFVNADAVMFLTYMQL